MSVVEEQSRDKNFAKMLNKVKRQANLRHHENKAKMVNRMAQQLL